MNPISDDEIRAKIAKACGWTNIQEPDPLHGLIGNSPRGNAIHLPDYCRDLNAMHEAEKMLDVHQFDRYQHYLEKVCYGTNNDQKGWITRDLILATASQRAEAFVKAIVS